jgi:hypothetical protein
MGSLWARHRLGQSQDFNCYHGNGYGRTIIFESHGNEMTQLRKLVSQLQSELSNIAKQSAEDKEFFFDELKTTMIAQFEGERSSLEVFHAHELKELWKKMETTS